MTDEKKEKVTWVAALINGSVQQEVHEDGKRYTPEQYYAKRAAEGSLVTFDVPVKRFPFGLVRHKPQPVEIVIIQEEES